MWEPDSGSGNSSSNRGVALLIIAVSACILLYKAWGPLLLITCTLVLVVHTCYSLLFNDSLLAPHTLILLRSSREIAIEITQTVRVLFSISYRRCSELLEYLKRKYEERYKRKFHIEQPTEDIMNGRHKNVYRLSTTSTELDEQVSPINNDPYHLFALNGACDIGRTSTPISRGLGLKKSVQQNGDLRLLPSIASPSKKLSHLRIENRPPGLIHARSEETLYSKDSHWRNNTSPKIRDRAMGVKTVQTIAGPLLATTRYNIDPKVYADISSPGLTSRLTKYATEASNKLTHQSQYGTGQFPKVNLNASPIPIINTKVAKARMPVTVRIAPPESINYSPSENHVSHDRLKMFSNISPSEAKESKSCPSVAQVLKVMSLKRHATVEDKMIDMLAKKQRMERTEGQLENLEEIMQKRTRDDSINSEDDLSPQSKTQRPLKRPKASSCHDILNSLSSSISVASGIKRKAMDTSRCSTSDNEKHFKSASVSPNRSTSLTFHSSEETSSAKEQANVNILNKNASGEPYTEKNSVHDNSSEALKKIEYPSKNQTDSLSNSSKLKVCKEIPEASKSPKLTDKLFMRAEPCLNEKLKNLIEEQSSIEAKFSSDDKDEIKKQDIVNMRQNNMRLRLQSMFDAISGKSASKIDPDVVIQAEEVNPPTSSTYTVLSSSTSTTTINTSPILTTIVPILKTDSDQKTSATKHVTFNLPTTSSLSSNTTSNTASLQPSKEVTIPAEAKRFDSGTSSFQGLTPSIGTTASINFSNNAIPASGSSNTISSSSTSTTQSTGSGFSFLATTVASSSTSKNDSTEIKNTENISSLSTNTGENTRASVIVGSTGYSFGQSSKSVTQTSTISSAPIISFETSTVAKSSEIFSNSGTVPRFGNQLSKNTTSTFITAPVTTNSETNFSNSTPNFVNQLSKSPTNTAIGSPINTFATSKEGNFTCVSSGNTTTTKSQTAPIFGITSSSPMLSASNSTMSITPSTTSVTQAPLFTFGGGPNKTTTGGFSFGATSAVSTATSPSIFGSSATTLTNVNAASTPTPTFGVSVASTSIANTTPITSSSAFGSSTSSLFGASVNSSGLFSGSSNAGPTSIFKAPTTTASISTTVFGSQTNPPAFGTAATPTVSTAITTSPNIFGNISNVNTTTTTAVPSIFGNTAATSPPAATSPISTFNNPFQQQASQGNIFSGVNVTTSAAPSIFGAAITTSPTGLFSGASTNPAGSNLAPTARPADSAPIFGQAKTPASLSFGAASPTFGSTNSSSSFSVPSVSNTGNSAFSIGAVPSTSNLPSFNAIKPTLQFGTQTNPAINAPTNPPAGSTTSIFGSTTNTFGASAATSSTFGTASVAGGGFGMQTGASFGTSPTSTTSPFAGQPTATSTTSLFGNVAPAASGFSFGSMQSTQSTQQQQSLPYQTSATFSFSGATNNNAPASGGLFQFGGSNTAKPAGFNFNAPNAAPAINFTGSTAPPAFNAPTTNMFSIGSGSSTPRSRTSRPRRQQR